jgi:hypothetical protein
MVAGMCLHVAVEEEELDGYGCGYMYPWDLRVKIQEDEEYVEG